MMVSGYNGTVVRNRRKMIRLAFIKARHKKLILEPKKEIKSEIERDTREEDCLNDSYYNILFNMK